MKCLLLIATIFSLMMSFTFKLDSKYRTYSFKLFEEKLHEYNNRYDVRNDCSKYLSLSVSDTTNIKINIPIFSLLNPEVNKGLCDYAKLNSLIDYCEDYESQYVVIKKETKYIVMSSMTGLSKRWVEYNNERILTEDLTDVKIIPDDRIVWIENYNFEYKHFSLEKLEEYLSLNPQLTVFSIYNLTGLFSIKGDKLIRLDFTKKGIKELDGEVYYQKNIINNGFEKIKEIVIGGDPFWIR